MNNNFEKFVKKVIKNQNFLILKNEENLLVVGIKLDFIERIINTNNPFSSPQNKFYERKWPVVFLITNKSTLSEIEREFTKKGFPILNLAKEKDVNFSEEKVNDILEKFIKKSFKNDEDKYTVL